MKRFIKSLAGKSIIFIMCIISVCLFVVSVAGIVFFTRSDLDFYGLTEKELQEKVISKEFFQSYGDAIVWNEFGGIPKNRCEYKDDVNYQIVSANNTVVLQSSQFKDTGTVYELVYGVLRDGGLIYYYFTAAETNHVYNSAEYYTVRFSPIEGTSLAVKVDFWSSLLHIVYSLRYWVYFLSLGFLLLAITFFIMLMYASGRRSDTDEFCEGPLYKVPYDLLLAICVVAGVGVFLLADWFVDYCAYDEYLPVCLGLGLCVVGLNALLGLCMSAAGRIKQHTFIKNTVIYKVLVLTWKGLCLLWKGICRLHRFNKSVFRNITLIWKTGIVFCAISFLELLIIVCCDGRQDEVVVMWLAEKIILLPAVLFLALILRRLQKSGAMLANGDLSYHTDTKGMFWDFKEHGENLNSIAEGMAIAVEDRLKSERMKTELITNVSHDIKTPLTSIINYATLIGEEKCDNPTITEYSEVLVRQSEKLKRLIEDLVEASKASTGNLEVFLAPCDASVFITQASGEYEEKLQKSQLTLLTKVPEKELRIMADGRRMWRVFDNLMNNICKYSLPGTRVYLSLEEQGKNAVITFKNTSREPLDMSEEELMERFTRGDSSRNTEGNGLGLSIAKSMAELQGGSLKISIDGDLFKAVLSFRII